MGLHPNFKDSIDRTSSQDFCRMTLQLQALRTIEEILIQPTYSQLGPKANPTQTSPEISL